jgi:ELWxxDGT repeat protein
MKNILCKLTVAFFLLITSILHAQVPYRIGVAGDPNLLFNSYGTLYFVNYDYTTSDIGRLWKCDGTTAGTIAVRKFPPVNSIGAVRILTGYNLNNKLLFIATDSAHGNELWSSDGTDTGTFMIKDIYKGMKHSDIDLKHSVTMNGMMFFSARDSLHGMELWKTDGTEQGTVLVKDIAPGFFYSSTPPYYTVINSNPYELIIFNNTLYFTASDSLGGELWKSDGTEAGTVLFKDLYPGPNSSQPRSLVVMNGKLYFTAPINSYSSCGLWVTDGTDTGTTLVKQLTEPQKFEPPFFLIPFNNNLYFWNDDGTGKGKELWKSDGTKTGTALLKDIIPGVGSSEVQFPVVTLTKDYFTFWTVAGLWRTDGTIAGTYSLAKGFSQDNASAATRNGIVYFPGISNINTPEQNRQIWRTDGTIAGTLPIDGTSCIIGTWGYGPKSVTEAGGEIFFNGCAPSNGYTLWKLDFTATSASDLNKINDPLLIFPNPFTSSATLRFSTQKTNCLITLVDVLGNEIKKIIFSGTELVIEKEELSKGIYFIQLVDEHQGYINKKIIIQ